MQCSNWTKEDEQHFHELKETAIDRGRSEPRAEEIAARTVNKHRKRERATESDSTFTDNPFTKLETRTREELLKRARELAIDGRNQMSRKELIQAIRDH